MLTPERIAGAASDEHLYQMLGKELERWLPKGRRPSPDFVDDLRQLPAGFRAMVATFELDVSLTMDDLGWHFGNWHLWDLAEETAVGLVELEANELADIFRQAMSLAKMHWDELGSDGWSEWYHGSALETAMSPLNDQAWALLEPKSMGIMSYWLDYARKYPERICGLEPPATGWRRMIPKPLRDRF